MDIKSIKKHLKPYSIYKNRLTTINHAFASALAINDEYSEEKIGNALGKIGLNPADLNCFYCETNKAQTWDHIINLVDKGNFRGYGHQVGNLVPSCKVCNEAKGRKDWYVFLESKFKGEKLEEKKKQLEEYMSNNVTNTLPFIQELVEDLKKYSELKDSIFTNMQEADEIAREIRAKVKNKLDV